MFLKTLTSLFLFFATLQLVASLPGSSNKANVIWLESPQPLNHTLERETITHSGISYELEIIKRDDDPNCSLQCEYTDVTVVDSACNNNDHSLGPTTSRVPGTYVLIQGSEIVAGRDINISLSDNDRGGLIVIVIENSVIHAARDINININNNWQSEGCELWLRLRDVEINAGQDVNIISGNTLRSLTE